MRKFLSLLGIFIIIGITSCSDEACDHGLNTKPSVDNSILGTWYVETENEEINYDETGTFYDRYSNVRNSGETEGRYEFNKKAMKLTYRYTYLGQNVTADWVVSDLNEYRFKISSETSIGNTLEKIVEKHRLKVGEKISISYPSIYDLYVYSYTSQNEQIASVSTDGTVTAMGAKGTTYIKINTDKGNLWAKITIGEDNKDLWCDYATIIGANYKTMTEYFSSLGKPASDGADYYVYPLSIHEYLQSVNILMDSKKDIVTAIQIFLRDGISPSEIKSYLRSRFYEHEDLGLYSLFPEIEESKVILKFDQENRCVTYFDTQTTLHPELWYDFTKLFGLNKNEVNKDMEKQGYTFLMSDYSYSKGGSDYYNVIDNTFVQMAGFVFNPDKEVSQIWLYLDITSNANEVYYYLCNKYQENESESTDYSLVFYNNNKSLKVVFDLISAAIIYTDLTMKQHEPVILGNYYEGIGMTHDQIIAQYGTPYSEDGGKMIYYIGSQYVNLAVFYMNSDTNKCKSSAVTINQSVETSTIVEYLNSMYTVFANGTASDGSQYSWTNGASVEESSLGICYYPKDRMVVYVPLGSSANAKDMNRYISLKLSEKNIIDRTKSMTISKQNNSKEFKNYILMHRTQQLQKIFDNNNQ